MRLLGINSITATRTSKALYVLPVPMGSPLNYLGVGDSAGSVSIFDPGYCAVNSSYGAGDHWIAGSQNPVSTYYNLWDTNGNVYKTADYILKANSGSLFESQTGSDTALGGPGSMPACDAYHDKWWPMATGLPAGLYYLQVTTTKVLSVQRGPGRGPRRREHQRERERREHVFARGHRDRLREPPGIRRREDGCL
jgi:hypothetical protein